MSNALHSSAARVRAARARRRRGERVVFFEIRDGEIAALVTAGYLAPDLAADRSAIADALGRLLDQIEPRRWPNRRLDG
ncbi:MAG: hypothetical protein ACJ8AI_10600 [Rhodopila sp.]